MDILAYLMGGIRMLVFSPIPGLNSALLATIFLFIYWKRINSKLSFWLLSILICAGANIAVSFLALLGYFAGKMENNWVTGLTIIGSVIIWLSVSIFGIKILAKKYINSNTALNPIRADNARID